MPETFERGTPGWWLLRLDAARRNRAPEIRRYNAYYDGDQPLLFATEKFKRAFGSMFVAFADNWCELVVSAVEERLDVEGFRLGDMPSRRRSTLDRADPASADQDAWTIWQRNQLDADSQLAHTEALIAIASGAIVWADEDGKALITVEQPEQIAVEYVPGSRRERAAGLKRWDDEERKLSFATLYLPESVWKFQAPFDSDMKGLDTGDREWKPRDVGNEDWPLENPLGVVPLVPLVNRPRIGRPGSSELKSVIPMQDAVNKLLTDMIVASEYGAFRQRWATGWDVPTDPETNQPVFDSVKASMERFWYSSSEMTTFGEFEQTDLQVYVGAIEMAVQHIASQTRTPPHYLNASADRLSGESIKAAETGLVAKVTRKQRAFGEAWEEVMRLALKIEDSPGANAPAMETIWRDPESRTESEHIDAVVKKQALGVPNEQLWTDAGYSPQQIERFKAMGAEPGVPKPPVTQPPPEQPAA